MRVEEESEDGWFALPLVDDADVNWMDFEVDICGPVRALLRSEARLPCQLNASSSGLTAGCCCQFDSRACQA